MTKTELAGLLDISISMVSRLTKRGMPTDSLERAQRWRKRHLEPGRTKGVRVDTRPPPDSGRPARRPGAAAGPGLEAVHMMSAQTVDRFGLIADHAVRDGAFGTVAGGLREALRLLPDDQMPRFTLRVWIALTEYMLHEESTIREHDGSRVLTQSEFAMLASGTADFACIWRDAACDHHDIAVHGWDADNEEAAA